MGRLFTYRRAMVALVISGVKEDDSLDTVLTKIAESRYFISNPVAADFVKKYWNTERALIPNIELVRSLPSPLGPTPDIAQPMSTPVEYSGHKYLSLFNKLYSACPSCGGRLFMGYDFCPHCGKSINFTPSQIIDYEPSNPTMQQLSGASGIELTSDTVVFDSDGLNVTYEDIKRQLVTDSRHIPKD